MAKQKNDKEELGTALGIIAIAALAIWASKRAYKSARETNVPLVIEEGEALYELFPDGSKRLIKKLTKVNRNLPPNFTLK